MHRFRAILRSLVVPLSLYAFSAAVASYFIWHGVNGQRGLKASTEYEMKIAKLRDELEGLKSERTSWERKIALIRGDQVDADILEDEVRSKLGKVYRNEVVILTSRVNAAMH
jgi:cell division protein FtsB